MDDAGDSLTVGWGNKSLGARGPFVIGILCVLALIAAVLGSSYRLEQTVIHQYDALMTTLLAARANQRTEHEQVQRQQELLICVLQLTPEQRKDMRSYCWAWLPSATRNGGGQ